MSGGLTIGMALSSRKMLSLCGQVKPSTELERLGRLQQNL